MLSSFDLNLFPFTILFFKYKQTNELLQSKEKLVYKQIDNNLAIIC